MCSLITLCLPLSLLSSLPLSLSLSVLVSVTVLTKALIWGRWLLSMCRHPGCRGNQSKVVSKRQRRPLQCSRKTAAQVWTWSDGMHSSSHHDTHSHTILQTLTLSLPLAPEDITHNSSVSRVGGFHRGWSCLLRTINKSSHLEIRVKRSPRVNTWCSLFSV